MTDLDAIEKRARDAKLFPGGLSATKTAALAADVLALVAEVRLARAWLAAYDGPDNGPTITEHEAAEAYRAFLAKREAP